MLSALIDKMAVIRPASRALVVDVVLNRRAALISGEVVYVAVHVVSQGESFSAEVPQRIRVRRAASRGKRSGHVSTNLPRPCAVVG